MKQLFGQKYSVVANGQCATKNANFHYSDVSSGMCRKRYVWILARMSRH